MVSMVLGVVVTGYCFAQTKILSVTSVFCIKQKNEDDKWGKEDTVVGNKTGILLLENGCSASNDYIVYWFVLRSPIYSGSSSLFTALLRR